MYRCRLTASKQPSLHLDKHDVTRIYAPPPAHIATHPQQAITNTANDYVYHETNELKYTNTNNSFSLFFILLLKEEVLKTKRKFYIYMNELMMFLLETPCLVKQLANCSPD